ncbi:hypothetical protein [Streptomyces sp. UNOC14_S4]|uniref:hypothetical protein n=1 Tax=Streptomyces sp. UNOC14_S4 TaxID=2872340 RepID=UPI001E541084|nr:hypothetical protein [Streptomyces sp. UNOC14_S4]MCC3766457.1 hypothetical protein [Streptomyces sp. UNOC14_S4]
MLAFERDLEKLLGHSYRPEKVTKGILWRDSTGVLATGTDIADWLVRLWGNNPAAFEPGEGAAVKVLVEARENDDRPLHRRGRTSNDCIEAWRRLRPLLEDRDESWGRHEGGADDMKAVLGVLRDELNCAPERFTAPEAVMIMTLPEGESLPPEALVLYGKVLARRQVSQAR